MKTKLLRPLSLVILLAAAFAATALTMAFVTSGHVNPQTQAQESKQKILRDVARERDIEISSQDDAEYGNLRVLAKSAEAIVLGRIIESKSAFTESGKYITTEYEVEVQRVLKHTRLNATPLAGQPEPAPLTTPLKIVRPGGVVNVNGHRAAVRVKGQESLSSRNEYVFFLWWGPNQEAYYLAGGISGAVLVDGKRRVRPLALSTKIRTTFDGMDLENFINEVMSGNDQQH